MKSSHGKDCKCDFCKMNEKELENFLSNRTKEEIEEIERLGEIQVPLDIEISEKNGFDATLFYILSFLIPIAGFIVGAMYIAKEEEKYRRVGENCMKWAIVSIVIWFILILAMFS